MKLLRETIQNIILENIQEKNTIINTILDSTPQGINTFLEFAETLGYLKKLRYEIEPPTSFFPEEAHTWHFYAEAEFGETLVSKYNDRTNNADSKIITVDYNKAFLERTGQYSMEINAIGPSE